MRLKSLAVLAAMPLMFVGCGDSKSGGAGGVVVTPGASINSQFIDAPVKGLKFVSDSVADGITGDNGIFGCKAGELVTFKIFDKTIGSASCGEKIYISDVNPGAGNSTDAAAALIQSLSQTVGGVLDLSTFNAAPVSLASVDLDGTNTDSTIAALALPSGLTPVLVADAIKHVQANLPDQSNDAVLAAIAAAGTQTLKLEASPSNREDHCWEGIQVKVNLEEIDRGEAGGKAYRFNVTEYLAWDGENMPSYTPGTDCNGEEHGGNGVPYFQCLVDPVKKIMTGRSVWGSEFKAYTFNIPANETAICKHDGGYEFNYNSNAVVCSDDDGETPYAAAVPLTLNVDAGWNFAINVTNSSYSVSFVENAVDIGANLNSEGKVTSYTQDKFNCSYSLSETLDLGESEIE